MLVFSGAHAGWEKAFITDTANHYIDPQSVEKVGNVRRIWTLQDLKSQGVRGERSMKALMEYECDKERVRVVNATAHSGQMAAGDVVARVTKPASWTNIAPNSAFRTTLNFDCR